MLLNDLIEGLKDMFFTFLYTCFRCICELIDFIREIFYMLCGIEPVEIDGSKGDMLTSLLKSDSVKKAFLTILLIGVILLVLFTGIAILKSNYQEKQSWAGEKYRLDFHKENTHYVKFISGIKALTAALGYSMSDLKDFMSKNDLDIKTYLPNAY